MGLDESKIAEPRRCNDASLRWVSLTASHDLDLEVDQLALAEYLRVYGDAGDA